MEVCVLDDSYHLVTLDRQRNYVAERSIEFAERTLAQAASRKAAAKAAAQLAEVAKSSKSQSGAE